MYNNSSDLNTNVHKITLQTHNLSVVSTVIINYKQFKVKTNY